MKLCESVDAEDYLDRTFAQPYWLSRACELPYGPTLRRVPQPRGSAISGELVVLVLCAAVRPKVRFAVVKDDPLVRGLLAARQAFDRLTPGKFGVIAEVAYTHGLDGRKLRYPLPLALTSTYPHH
ncbi:hypothetical protein [Rhodococcus sp. AW25M09]|uniref:hypothetical protein n=1 Tax=Rhodococcus sp. AW25M09 TaxID=1268303 RepID=UPI00034D5A0D|nr:hypothetical protein [Rhodococcus sp. AW25M09]